MTRADSTLNLPHADGRKMHLRATRCALAAALPAALSALLASCAVGPDFTRPEPPAVERYTATPPPLTAMEADGKTQVFKPGAAVASEWWRLFNSAELDAAVHLAMEGNATLQSAQASLRQSQESLKAGYGVFYPSVGLGFAATRQRVSPFGLGFGAALGVFNLYTLSTTVSYVLDVFGGERRAVEGLAAQADYQRYTMFATFLTVSGNVVNTLIARAAYVEQIRATEELIALQTEQLEIARAQASAGTASYASVLSVQGQLATSRATIPVLRQRRDQADHLLASLVGRTPAEWQAPALDFASLSLPQELPLSLPSELVRQRPDILAAEAQLHAASAGLGVATAALFPSFTLNGTYGANNNTIGNLTNSNDRFWSAGAGVEFPLFEGGASWYRKEAAAEAYRKSLADYRQAILSAFAQVADTLTALEHDAQGVQAQADAVNSAEQALHLLQANYRAGLVSYVDVLVADAQFHQAKIGYLQTVAQRYQDTTALFLALGGGWQDLPLARSTPPSKEPGP